MTGAATCREGPSDRPDPIALAIQRHARLEAAADAAYAADLPDEAKSAANSAAWRALWGLVETRPTTIAGIIALCNHIARYESRDRVVSGSNDYDSERNWRFMPELLRNITSALTEIERQC